MSLVLIVGLFASLIPEVRDQTRSALGLPKFSGQNGIFNDDSTPQNADPNPLATRTPQNTTIPSNTTDTPKNTTTSAQTGSSDTKDSPQGSNSTVYIAVGCAAGAVTLLFAIGGIVYSKKRKSKSKSYEAGSKNSDNDSIYSNDSIVLSSEELEKIEKDMDYNQFMEKRKSILLPIVPSVQ